MLAEEPKMLFYRLRAVPDRTWNRHQLRAGGDVAGAVRSDLEQLCRKIVSMLPGAVVAALRFLLKPRRAVTRSRDRLEIYVLARAADRRTAKTLRQLLETGPLSRFHKLDQVNTPPVPADELAAACYVTRRVRYLAPAVEPDVNPHVPERYLTAESLEARGDNDYLALDRLAEVLDGGAIIDIVIAPYAADPERAAWGRYGALLEKAARARYAGDSRHLEGLAALAGAGGSGFHPGWPDYHDDPAAESLLRNHRKIQENLLAPQAAFSLRVLAEDADAAGLLASTLAESAFEGGVYDLRCFGAGDPFLAEAIRDAGDVSVSAIPPLEEEAEYPVLRRLCWIGSVDELAGAFRPMLAGFAPLCCARRDTDPPRREGTRGILLGHECATGAAWPEAMHLFPEMLCRHSFMTGMTGSGKTTANLQLVLETARLGIPVLVIEASKHEYRFLATLEDHPDPAIARFAREFEVYPAGLAGVSALCINGFQSPADVSVDERIARAQANFRGALPLGAPLPELLFEALEEMFYTAPDPANPPTMADLSACTGRVLDAKTYSGELAGNLRAALETRLNRLTKGMMGRLFHCKHSIPDVSHFFEQSCLIELDILPLEEKALFFNFLIDKIREYVKQVPWSGTGPRLVVLCDEAHQLIGGTADARANESAADPRAMASDLLLRALLEFRSLGVGFMLSTPLPSSLPPEVLKAVCTREALQQDHAKEREILAGAMGMGPWEMDALPLLATGECFVMSAGMARPVLVQGANPMEVLFP